MENTTINALQTEVEFYRQNQNAVEDEIRTLISDNQKLSQQVGMLLKEKLDNARQGNGRDEAICQELDEARKQLTLLAKERDSLHVLWQTSQKTIEALETELKAYQSYEARGKHENTIEDRRGLELKLETSLTDYIELEKKHNELIIEHNNLQNDIKSNDKEIASYKERGKDTDNKLNELIKSLEELRISLAVEKKDNEDLKQKFATSQKECVDRVKKEAEAKSKVAEALQLFDLVSNQKSEAYKTIQNLTKALSELKHLQSVMRRDIEGTFRKELDEAKDKYNEKVSDMLYHIRNLDAELVEKGLLLNKTMRENKILQTANDNYLKQQKNDLRSIDPKLALAEQRLEVMFQELVASERRNMQLVCEKQCLAVDMQRVQGAHSREVKRRDWEEQLLRTKADELRLQVEHLQKSLDETHEMINKLQRILSSRTELNQKMVSTKEEELTELNKHLENQMQLSKKWKESYMEMTEKLKKKLQDLERENNELRTQLNLPGLESPEDS